MARGSSVISPNLGLYAGLDSLSVPQRAVADGRNFRIEQGVVGNVNLGWQEHSALDFGNPIKLIDTFFIRGTSQKQLIVTTEDIFDYDQENDTALYLNRRYATGTVETAGTAVTGTGTGWTAAGIKVGDYFHVGNAAQRSLSASWHRITAVGDTSLTLATSAGVVGAGAVYTIRRTLTGTDESIYDSETFVAPDDGVGADLWFVTNGIDYVHTWDGSATQVIEQSSMGFKAKRLAAYKNMMLYVNILLDNGTFLPTSCINSDIGKPLAAGDDGTGLSEQFRVHDGVDHILELEDMGDNMVFYSSRRIVLAQFVGDPLVFVFREAASGVGPLAARLIADFGDYHEFIGADSQYLFDGVSVTEVGQQVWREVLRQRDPVRQELGFCHFDEERGDLLWCVPLTSDANVGVSGAGPEEAFVEHYLEEVADKTAQPVSRRQMPFITPGFGTVLGALTWDEISDTWDQMVVRWNESTLFAAFPLNLMGDADGTLWKINTVQTGAGALLPSYIRTGRRPLGDARMRGLLTRVYAFAKKFDSVLAVILRIADHASGPITVLDEQEMDTSLPEGGHFTTHYRRGRFFELQFGTDGEPWQISGYDTDVRPGGKR